MDQRQINMSKQCFRLASEKKMRANQEMFWSSSQYPNHHGCLSPEECNFYLAGTKWIIYTAESAGGERPDEATFISVDVQGSAFFYDYTDYFHQMNIEYGILHIAPNPPIPID